jgi:hypothetical protein
MQTNLGRMINNYILLMFIDIYIYIDKYIHIDTTSIINRMHINTNNQTTTIIILTIRFIKLFILFLTQHVY